MSKASGAPIKSGLGFNIVLVGDSAVGKSCIIGTLLGKPFKEGYITTMGIDKENKNEVVDGIEYCFKIWDTTGQERFAALATNYLRKADGVIFVYAINDRHSFENILSWLELLKKSNSNETLKMSLVGNKVDLEHLRQVSKEEGEALASKLSMVHTETSAKTGAGLQETYKGLVKSIIEAKKGKIEKKLLNLNKPAKSKGFC